MEEKGLIHKLYRDLIHSGMAFGAERWLGSLQRLCERYACLMVSGKSSRELGGGIMNRTCAFMFLISMYEFKKPQVILKLVEVGYMSLCISLSLFRPKPLTNSRIHPP